VRRTDTSEKAALQYRGVRTDDGCVVIRHTTEIGEGDHAKVTFFSIYLHLQSIVGAIAVGKAVYRKDKLGVAGQIYGQEGQIHAQRQAVSPAPVSGCIDTARVGSRC
jgi:hydroxyethylthiazole kinase